MLKSYEAIYDHGRIKWLGEAPKFKRMHVVLVADDDYEMDETLAAEKPNGAQLVSIIRATPSELLTSIAEKFGDPVEWQREQRKDRILPGRESD